MNTNNTPKYVRNFSNAFGYALVSKHAPDSIGARKDSAFNQYNVAWNVSGEQGYKMGIGRAEAIDYFNVAKRDLMQIANPPNYCEECDDDIPAGKYLCATCEQRGRERKAARLAREAAQQ